MEFLNFHSHFSKLSSYFYDFWEIDFFVKFQNHVILNSLQFNLLLVTISHNLKLAQNNTPLYPAPKFS